MSSEKLFESIAAIDAYPMRDKTSGTSYFYKGVKVNKSPENILTVWDISDREGNYKKMDDEQIDKFMQKHFNKITT